MVYKFFDKNSMGSGIKKDTTKSTAEPSALARSSLILADELHKPAIKKLIKEKYIQNLKIIYGE